MRGFQLDRVSRSTPNHGPFLPSVDYRNARKITHTLDLERAAIPRDTFPKRSRRDPSSTTGFLTHEVLAVDISYLCISCKVARGDHVPWNTAAVPA